MMIELTGSVGVNGIDCPVYFTDEFDAYVAQIHLSSDDRNRLADWCVENMSSIRKSSIFKNIKAFFTNT